MRTRGWGALLLSFSMISCGQNLLSGLEGSGQGGGRTGWFGGRGQHGSGPGGSGGGEISAPSNVNKQIPRDLKDLSWDNYLSFARGNYERKAGNVKVKGGKIKIKSSQGMCGRGTSASVAELFGIPRSQRTSSGPGCMVKTDKLNSIIKGSPGSRCYGYRTMNAAEAARGLQPGDVISCNHRGYSCGHKKKGAGHAEIVGADGVINSDFRQKSGSLCETQRTKYNKVTYARIYKKPGCGTAMYFMKDLFLHAYLFSSFVLPNAHAEEQVSNIQPAREPNLASVQSEAVPIVSQTKFFKVEEVAASGGEFSEFEPTLFKLYKKVGDKWVKVAEPNVSAYAVLKHIEKKKEQELLADKVLSQMVKKVGSKEEMQKIILEGVAFGTIEKEAYLRAGYKMPDSYRIQD